MTFNRTILELKAEFIEHEERGSGAFNRTILELKGDVLISVLIALQLLIVPYWN